ncbi:exo-alpha-sialidase [Burkholderia guangdongensis]|uniref:exo-alpha-sialidase n=1 Tax=Burkholderia guangdongensis TaxID=1792500 RepID=UPI0015CE40B8|nr:exo-alpha-sialidase [Burkholderia guangdongensis]
MAAAIWFPSVWSCAQAYPPPPGVVVAHSPAASQIYLGSPSIAIISRGHYVLSHDTFGPGSTQDTEYLYESRDCGNTWKTLGTLKGQYWSSLFIWRRALYIMGTSGYGGVPTIRRSLDGGRTWTQPRDAGTGVLSASGKYFTAPVPVVAAHGRLWRAMEEVDPNGLWPFMMSAPVYGDLLKASTWTRSNAMAPNPAWLGDGFKGWLEGNAVVGPDGGVMNMLRVYHAGLPEKAALLTTSRDGARMEFDPSSGFVDLPGGDKKFTIRFDRRTRLYWSLVNAVVDGHHSGNIERARNTLALVSSPDLRNWTLRRIVLHHDDWQFHAFQYADWQFDGTDIVAAVRTSFDDATGGAHSQHDANYVTFHRIEGFRDRSDEVRRWGQCGLSQEDDDSGQSQASDLQDQPRALDSQ